MSASEWVAQLQCKCYISYAVTAARDIGSLDIMSLVTPALQLGSVWSTFLKGGVYVSVVGESP